MLEGLGEIVIDFNLPSLQNVRRDSQTQGLL